MFLGVSWNARVLKKEKKKHKDDEGPEKTSRL